MLLHLTFISSDLEDAMAIMEATLADMLAVPAEGHAALPHPPLPSPTLPAVQDPPPPPLPTPPAAPNLPPQPASPPPLGPPAAEDPPPAQINMQGLPPVPALAAPPYDIPPDQLFNSNWNPLAQSHNGRKARILALCCGKGHYLKGRVHAKKQYVVTGKEGPLEVQVFVHGSTVNLICLVCVLCPVGPSTTDIPL